jgi:hypothetical protein
MNTGAAHHYCALERKVSKTSKEIEQRSTSSRHF